MKQNEKNYVYKFICSQGVRVRAIEHWGDFRFPMHSIHVAVAAALPRYKQMCYV